MAELPRRAGELVTAPVWRDVSSYSRGKRGTVEPTSWELDTGTIRIVVTRRHGADGWFAVSYALNMQHVALAAADSDIAAAKTEAVEIIRKRLAAMLASLPPAPRAKRRTK